MFKTTKVAYLTTLFLLLGMYVFQAQDQKIGPKYIGEMVRTGIKPSINSLKNLPAPLVKTIAMKDGRVSTRRAKVEVVPGKGMEPDGLIENRNILEGRIPTRMPSLVFDAANTLSQPTDPSLAIGPDHVVVVFNTGIVFYDKTGTLISGPVGPGAVFADTDVCCDLTVSYDNAADRWVMSILSAVAAGNSRNLLQIAVSDGPNPVTSNWVTYEIQENSDYQKLSVYGNGYYMTNNGATDVFAMERNAMLAGDPTASIQGFAIPGIATSGFASPQFLNVSDDNAPTPGNAPLVFLQDNAYNGVNNDHIKFWNLDADFDTPANSTISQPQIINVSAFTSVFDGGAFDNLTQPNGGFDLDALQGIIMNQAQFRKFPTYNSAVFNHVVDVVDGTGEQAAVRWYEFRQDSEGQPWALFQEGTYVSPDGKHAWNASIIMDTQGNMGMGYTGMGGSNGVEASSFYTGRLASDPPGSMTLAETVIALGDGPIPGGSGTQGTRYGDYSKIDIDPSDDQTFWFVNEYHGSATPNSQRTSVVGRFKIAPDNPNDVGVVAIVQPEDGALSASETVQVMVRNFGIDNQSNFPISFSVDGGTPVTETYTETLASGATAMYTFTGTANLNTIGETYTITATTALAGDQLPANDSTTKNVTYLSDNDTGVTAISSPTSGSELTATETVTVTIQNFGAATQTNIPVFFNVDGGANVTETYVGSIAIGETDTYTFMATADLSGFGDHTIVAGTSLSGDSDTTNDTTTLVVSNISCIPTTTGGCNIDGIKQFVLNTINVDDGGNGCNTEPVGGIDGYADRTNLSTDLENQAGSNAYILQARQNWTGGPGVSALSAWVDFNDNGTFEASEQIIAGEFYQDDNVLEDFDFVVPIDAPLGSHILRVKSIDTSGNPADINDPCADSEFGEVQDYRVNIVNSLGVADNPLSNAEFILTSKDNKRFELSFKTSTFTDVLPVTIYNVIGQNLAYYTLESDGSGYNKTIDMSYVETGVYFVKVGLGSGSRVEKIFVK